MSESIWWPEEAWWERKALPLGFITLSFRQLATIMVSFLAAFALSLPFEFAIAGASFGGRAAVFCIVFGVGYMISSRRVKLLPIELQAFYYLRTEGMSKVWMKLDWLLFLDEQARGEDLVSPQRPRYRLTYIPLQDDVGKHLLTVRLDGSTEPLVSVDLLVQGRSAEAGESITRVK